MSGSDTLRGRPTQTDSDSRLPTALPREQCVSPETVHTQREYLRDHLTTTYSQPTADYTVNILHMWGEYGHQSPYVAPIWEYAMHTTGAVLPETASVRASCEMWASENRLLHPHAESGVATSYPRAPDALRTAIEEIADISRTALRDQYGETLRVYRGIDEHIWENHTDLLPDGGARIEPRAMESWTLDKTIAESYGRYTFERTIDIDDVLFYGDLFMSERPEEREIAVGGYTTYEIPFADLSWDRR